MCGILQVACMPESLTCAAPPQARTMSEREALRLANDLESCRAQLLERAAASAAHIIGQAAGDCPTAEIGVAPGGSPACDIVHMAAGGADSVFDAMDGDGDGLVSREEFRAACGEVARGLEGARCHTQSR